MRASVPTTVAAAMMAAGLAACTTTSPEAGRALFSTHCAGCHGADATGRDGAPDLTLIAARNDGVFPEAQVMSVIDGYTRRDQHGGLMPEFGALLEGRAVLWISPDGAEIPTPESLVALAAYLGSVQR